MPVDNLPMFASPLRRLGAILYDTLLVVALFFVVTALFLLFTKGEAVTSGPVVLVFFWRAALLLAAFGFFGFSWTIKGQTLGMQVWHICVERMDGKRPTWADVALRLLVAVLPIVPGLVVLMIAAQAGTPKLLFTVGLALLALFFVNYIVAWFDPQRRSWHDRFLRTRVVRRQD